MIGTLERSKVQRNWLETGRRMLEGESRLWKGETRNWSLTCTGLTTSIRWYLIEELLRRTKMKDKSSLKLM